MPQTDVISAAGKKQRLIDICLLVLVNLMWAAQYPAYRVVSNQMGPVTASAWVFLFASIALVPFLLRERRANRAVARRRGNLTRRDVFGFLIIGVLGLMPASALLAAGTERSTASNAALIYLTVPILTALLAAVLLTEKMTPKRWVGLVISLVGVLALSQKDLSSQSLTSLRFLTGNLLVLGACACSSLYNVYSKYLLERFTSDGNSGVRISDRFGSEPSSPALDGTGQMVGGSSLHSRNLGLAAHLESAELGYRDGALDVPVGAAGCEPGVHLDLSAAFPGCVDLRDHSARGHYPNHNHRRSDQSGRDRPGNRRRLLEYDEKRGGDKAMNKLKDRVAIVTGAGQGIGAAIARELSN